MSRPKIEAFLFDDTNEEKFADHGLTQRQVNEVLDSPYLLVRNRRRRRAQYLIIGRDHSAVAITIPIERANVSGIWRPVTAWLSKRHERSALNREGL